MKKFASCLIILFLFITAKIHPQNSVKNYSDYEESFGIQIYTGYNTFNLADAKNAFNKEKEIYQRENIPMPNQTEYPGNIMWGGNIYFFINRELSLSLGAEYTMSQAFSLYSDYSGNIYLRSTVKIISFNFGIKKYFMSVKYVQPFVGLSAGLLNGSFEGKNDISLTGTYFKSNQTMNYSKITYRLDLDAGLAYNINFAVIELEGGYRYGIIPSPLYKDITGYELYNPIRLNVSGFNLKLSVRFGIYW